MIQVNYISNNGVKVSTSLPENWEEVKQINKFDDLLKLYFTNYTPDDFKIKAIFTLTGLDEKVYNKLGGNGFIDDKEAEKLIQLFDVLEFLNTPLLDNPYLDVDVKGTKWRGPTKLLADQSGAEMLRSHDALTNYAETNDEVYLNSLLAVNYRPASGKNRDVYKDDNFEDNLAIVSKWPNHVKLGFLLFYNNAEEWWYNANKHLYEGAKQEVGADAGAWRKIIFSLNKALHKFDYNNMPRVEIYFALNQLHEERLQMEK